jgi:cysteine synthase
MFASALDPVGATPLVQLPRLKQENGPAADIAFKLAFFNPLNRPTKQWSDPDSLILAVG